MFIKTLSGGFSAVLSQRILHLSKTRYCNHAILEYFIHSQFGIFTIFHCGYFASTRFLILLLEFGFFRSDKNNPAILLFQHPIIIMQILAFPYSPEHRLKAGIWSKFSKITAYIKRHPFS